MQPTISTTKHIELRPNRDGQMRAYIAGTRVRVQDIYALAEVQGKSADEIVAALPHLTLGQVHAALSYYFDNRAQILEEIRQDEDFFTQLRSVTGPGPFARKLAGTDSESDPVSP